MLTAILELGWSEQPAEAIFSFPDLTPLKIFAEALAIGLLIGVERYKSRSPGEHKAAGLRTFAVFSLLGAVCGLLADAAFTVATFSALVVLLLIGYYRHSTVSLGATTESAAILTFWLGYLVREHERLAIMTAIVVVIILAFKQAMHEFVKAKITDNEFVDTLKFLAVVFVIYPLLPDQDLGPYELFNPSKIWLLIILVSTLSYLGYILIKILGNDAGLKISTLLGGIVSTPALTVSLAQRAREAPQFSRLWGLTAILGNSVQFPRLLVLVAVVDADLGLLLTLPFLGMFASGALGSLILMRRRREDELPLHLLLKNPYSLRQALQFGLYFVGILGFSRLATAWFGEEGIFVASAIGGLASTSAIALSVAELSASGTLTLRAAAAAILVALAANALAKLVLGWINSNRELAFWLAAGFLSMLALGTLLLFLLPLGQFEISSSFPVDSSR